MSYKREFYRLDAEPHARNLRDRYNGIKQRCFDVNSTPYRHYGGRGITMCEEWRDSFRAFYEWAIANGFDPSLSIERIDNDGNYEPSNCAWVDKKAQANNRRSSRIITVRGASATLQRWAEVSGISRDVLKYRLKSGWDVERALTQEPVLGSNQFSGR